MTTGDTVLLTGISGYIARHIALKLLDAGYWVRGTVRDMRHAEEVRTALAPHLADADAQDRLDFVALDLAGDDGWAEAMDGVDAVFHTASPFPMSPPRNPDDVIRPAVDGAIRALRAAHDAGVRRVIMTSSVAAVESCDLPDGRTVHDETDWSDVNDARTGPYSCSKTLAERAAWDFVRQEAPEIMLTTINPSLVLGAPLGGRFGTSVRVVQRIMAGRDPMQPRYGMGIVDVRDVAEAHLRALQTDASVGQRIIVSDRFVWMADMARILSDEFPRRRIATREAPAFVIRLIGLFDRAAAGIVPQLGRHYEVSNARMRSILGFAPRDARESLRETARYLVNAGEV